MNLRKNKIGILGGTFDPPHKGHIAISREAIKKFKLKKIIWAITKKNPFKKQSTVSLSNRIKHCKKIIGNINIPIKTNNPGNKKTYLCLKFILSKNFIKCGHK